MLNPEWPNQLFQKSKALRAASPNKKDVLFLVLFWALVFIPGLGMRDPWPADEPRFALAAKQMVETGQWFFPARGDEFYSDKPPVFMWSIAVFYALTGNLKLSFLLPSTFAALIVILLVYDLGRRLWNREIGLASAGSLFVFVQFVIQGKSAQIDMMVTMWITVALYGMVRYLLLGHSLLYYLGGSLCMGLGIITKGVGFLPIFLLIPHGVAMWRRMEPRNTKAKGTLLWAPLMMLLGVSLWFVPMLLLVHFSQDPSLLAYRDDILFRQTADRYLKAWHHIKPFWYFVLEVMPWAWLPFSLLIVNFARPWIRNMKRGDNRTWTLVLWCLTVLLFFSLTKGKRGVYILPMVPAFALLLGSVQAEVFHSRKVQAYFRILGVFFGSVFLGLGAFLLFGSETLKAKHLKDMSFQVPVVLIGSVLLLGVVLIVLSVLRWKNRFRGQHAILISFMLIWLTLSTIIWPTLNPIRSPRQMMADIQAMLGPDDELGMVSWKEQLLLYTHVDHRTFGFKKAHDDQLEECLAWLSENPEKRWLLINGTDDLSLGPFEAKEALFYKNMHKRDWYLFRASQLPN